MGIIKRGILGGFSGKVANVVGSSWKGISVMKSLPLSVANPDSAKQRTQRTMFSRTIAFALAILSVVIKPLWDRFAQGQSGFNSFISNNIKLFDDGVLPSPLANLKISVGRMAATAISAISAASGSTLKVDWVDDSGEGFKLETDEPFLVVINETTGAVVGLQPLAATRDDATVTVSVPGATGTDTYSVYLAFKRDDGTIVSNTGYLQWSA